MRRELGAVSLGLVDPNLRAHAWLVFNGTGTPAIIASANISGITDNGVGDYTFDFVTPLRDANSISAAFCVRDACGQVLTTGGMTTTNVRVQIITTDVNTATDKDYCCGAFFGRA